MSRKASIFHFLDIVNKNSYYIYLYEAKLIIAIKLLSKETGMPVLVAEDALSCVGEGTGRSLENIELLQRVVMTTKKLK